jgi:hypothetical protein
MRNKKAIVALLAVATLTLGGVVASFADEQSSTAVVEFTQPNWDDFEITRPGPEHCDRDPLNRGPFVLAWVPTFNFGIHDVGVDSTFDVLADPHPGGCGNHFVNVWDYRDFAASESNGWRVTVEQTSDFTQGTTTLANTEINFSGDVAPGRVTGFRLDRTTPMTDLELATSISIGELYHDPNGSPIVTFASAEVGQGVGSTAINLGQGSNIILDVPIADQRVGDFTANIRWVLMPGPGPLGL